MVTSSIYLLSLSFLITLNVAFCYDRVIYQTNTQQTCVEVTRGPTFDCRWPAGLNLNVDQIVLHGDIVAFKIRWFSGAWSGWYVPGVNDIDGKFNTASRRCSIPYRANTMRRTWSYFYDHTHTYILCRNP